MAEDERAWRLRHAHETHSVFHGHFGTATYATIQQKWSFLRDDKPANVNVDENDDQSRNQRVSSHFQWISEPVIISESAGKQQHHEITSRKPRGVPVQRFSELAPAASYLDTSMSKQDVYGQAIRGSCLTFGSAAWLGMDRRDSGNLTVPVTAYVAGQGRSLLQLSCVRRQNFHCTDHDVFKSIFRIPTLAGNSDAIWRATEPILQAVFSQADSKGVGDTFLAVRQASKTKIFEPLLRRDTIDVRDSNESLDPNMLLSLDIQVTGGCSHADVAFNPCFRRSIALVDVEGNWSTWQISGRRSATAKASYPARLKASGKVFSWAYKKRPDGFGLYFDGWHKVLWLSSNGVSVDRLMVCNRQTAKIFDLDGEEICSIDTRLNTNKSHSYILDVKPSLSMNTCLVLTTTDVLVFDVAQREWKDAFNQGPALLCSWPHFQSSSDSSLKLATFMHGNWMLVATHSDRSKVLYTRQVRWQYVDNHLQPSVTDAELLALPLSSAPGPIASLSFRLLQSTLVHGQSLEPLGFDFVGLFAQHEDLTLSIAYAKLLLGDKSSNGDLPAQRLRLPPSRSTWRKTGLRVDNVDDEADLAGFIVADHDSDGLFSETEMQEIEIVASSPSTKPYQASEVFQRLSHSKSAINDFSTTRKSITEMFESVERSLMKISLENQASQAFVFAELVETQIRIEDVEADSTVFLQGLGRIRSIFKEKLAFSDGTFEDQNSLLAIYETLFDSQVSSMSAAIPDRFRVQRERQVRYIALDMYLSNNVARLLTPELPLLEAPVFESQELPSSDQILHSDPVVQSGLPSSCQDYLKPTSHSQARCQSRSATSSLPPNVEPSPLPAALSRLSAYTKLSQPQTTSVLDDPSTTKHITSILSHLPSATDLDTSPDDYDWQAAEHAFTVDKVGGGPMEADGIDSKAAKKKAEKVAKARRRAQGDFQSQPQDLGMLPVRKVVVEIGLPKVNLRDESGKSNTQQGQIMSDGVTGGLGVGDSSSQAMGAMTLTQPERGVFANQAATDARDKPKKKKRRAGF